MRWFIQNAMAKYQPEIVNRLQPKEWNPADSHPVVMGMDVSPSTDVGNARPLICKASANCVAAVRSIPSLVDSVEFRVYGFGQITSTEKYADAPARTFEMPRIPDSLSTPLYELYVRMIAETVERFDAHSRDDDRDVRAAWIFCFSDFQPTDPQHAEAAHKAKELATEWDINLFMIGCGQFVDEQVITELSQPERPPVYMKEGHDFRQYFAWLAASLRSKSMSQPGQELVVAPLFGQDLSVNG